VKLNNVRIFSVSAHDGSKETLLEKSLEELGLSDRGCHLKSNRAPLPKVYNKAIRDALSDGVDALILVHDDVTLNENPIPKLEQLFDEFDLVGAAGTSRVEIKQPALWHLMSDKGSLHGSVFHYEDEDCIKSFETHFGSYPHRAVMIDGVFMAMNRKLMENMLLDEANPSPFHFYDLSFSMDCHLAGFKVGVGDVIITHASHGLKEFTDSWKDGSEWFIKKYGY